MSDRRITYRVGVQQRLLAAVVCALMAGLLLVQSVSAALSAPTSGSTAPAAQAEQIRQELVLAQLKLQDDGALATQQVQDAQTRYLAELAPTVAAVAPDVDARIQASLEAA